MLYFQTPLLAKLPKGEPTQQELEELAIKYLKECKKLRTQVKEDKNGVFKVQEISNIKKEIIEGSTQVSRFFLDKKITGIQSIKPSLFGNTMNYTGISGYYNPFTTEAQYNAKLPSSITPFTISHEYAHQLGYAREQEANFIGYLISQQTKNPEIQYSCNFYVLKSLLRLLIKDNPELVKQIVNNYSDGMKRDRLYEKRFFIQHEGILDQFFMYTNNLFLQTNQQDGSISYSYFIDLLVRYKRL